MANPYLCRCVHHKLKKKSWHMCTRVEEQVLTKFLLSTVGRWIVSIPSCPKQTKCSDDVSLFCPLIGMPRYFDLHPLVPP